MYFRDGRIISEYVQSCIVHFSASQLSYKSRNVVRVVHLGVSLHAVPVSALSPFNNLQAKYMPIQMSLCPHVRSSEGSLIDG